MNELNKLGDRVSKPSQMPIVASATNKGLVRRQNQDRILIDASHGLYLLADGMGGHLSGEVAAQIAVDSIADEAKKGNSLLDCVVVANEAIQQAALANPQFAGMGTTVVALSLKEGSFNIAWVGDSRAYRVRDSEISQLTTDHSLVQELMDAGLISREEAHTHPARNQLTRALGISEDLSDKVGVTVGDLEPGETLVICSDGLHGLVSDTEIARTISTHPHLQPAVDELIQMSLDAGGDDNVSIIAVTTGSAAKVLEMGARLKDSRRSKRGLPSRTTVLMILFIVLFSLFLIIKKG